MTLHWPFNTDLNICVSIILFDRCSFSRFFCCLFFSIISSISLSCLSSAAVFSFFKQSSCLWSFSTVLSITLCHFSPRVVTSFLYFWYNHVSDDNYLAMSVRIGSNWNLKDLSLSFSTAEHLNSSVCPERSVVLCVLCLRETQSMQIRALQFAEQFCFGCSSQKQESLSLRLPIYMISWLISDFTRTWTSTQGSDRLIPSHNVDSKTKRLFHTNRIQHSKKT